MNWKELLKVNSEMRGCKTMNNNEIKIFENVEFGKVRVIEEDGKPLFCGKDIAEALGYNEPHKAISRHCKGGMKRPIPTNGGQQELLFIPEGDVYRLIVSSKLPSAEKFEHWVFDDVLPTIRKTGGYLGNVENMSDLEILGRAMMIYKRTVEEQHKQIEEMKPKAEFADRVTKSTDNILMRQMAKLLCDKGYSIGEKRLYQLLRDQKILMKNNEPYQQYVDKGYFVVQEGTYTTPNDKQRLYHTTKVTPVGQMWLIEKVIPRLEIA